MSIPFQNNKLFKLFLIFLLFIMSFSYLMYGYEYFRLRSYHVDEATTVYGAVCILNGGKVYHDFWSFHVPGRYYVMAAVFKIFGTSLKANNLFAIFILTLTVCGIFFFISRLYSRILGLFALLLSSASLKFLMMYNRPVQFALLFYILSLFPLSEYINSGKRKWLIIGGVLTGFIGVFRLDFQIYNLISFLMIIILKIYQDHKEVNWRTKIEVILKDIFYLIMGAFLISLPNFLYFINNGGFKELQGYVLSGIFDKNKYIPLPKLTINNLLSYFPVLVCLLASFKLIFYDLRAKNEDKINCLKVFFLVSTVLFYIYTLKRADEFHFYPARVPAIILFAMVYNDFIKKCGKKKYFIWAVSFTVGLWLLFCSIKPYFIEMNRISQNRNKYKIDIPRARGFYDTSEYARSVVAAVKYIQNNTKKDDKIFVGNLRHDRITNNDVMFYFLSERFSATKYCHFEPGFTTTRKIQQEIIKDLIRNNVQYIVLWTASEYVSEPNESSISSGIKDLDNFIREHYKIEIVFGNYIILKYI